MVEAKRGHFLGKLLIEKLLRSCPDVKNIYVLMRAKRGKTIEERLKTIIESKVGTNSFSCEGKMCEL